jgi:hypothetical protein
MNQIAHELKQKLKDGKGWERLADSVNSISELILAIGNSDGDEWADQLKDKDGQPLFSTQQEKERFTDLFRNVAPLIRQYLHPTHQGGADPLPSVPNTSSPSTSSTSSLSPSINRIPSGFSMPPIDIDLDGAFTSLVNKTEQINQFAEGLSSEYGLTRLERDYDKEEDFHLLPEPIRVMIGSLGPTGLSVKQVLDQIKIPYRFIVFLVYLYLDISRLAASTAGFQGQQKVYTIALALLELFRGDWKKAILTFMGLYGSTPLMAGQIAKVFLYLFERLSPTIQDRMIYGAWDTSKSLLLGVLLSIFQITAPMSVRKPFMDVLQTLTDGKKQLNQSLVEAGLEPRSDQFEPTWSDINRLQAVNDDPVFICSCEYQELIKNVGDSAMMRLILQLLRMPVNEEMRKKYTCVDRTPCKPYVEALKEEQAPAPAAPVTEEPSAPVPSVPEPTVSIPVPPVIQEAQQGIQQTQQAIEQAKSIGQRGGRTRGRRLRYSRKGK